MRTSSFFLGLAGLLIGLAIFSCRDHRADVGTMDESAPEKIAVAPLKRSFNPAQAMKPPILEPTAGPRGTFSEFQRLTSETLERLPRVEEMRKNAQGDAHFSPPDLLAASPSLGRIATSLRENPELIPQGIEFYRDCARREGTLTAVRVLCLRNLRFWAKEQKDDPEITDVDARDYPEDLWKLADSLPPVVR